MSPAAAAVLSSWRLEPLTLLALALTAALYTRGWRHLQGQMPDHFPRWRLVSFHAGLAVLYVAIASPLDAFAGLLLQVHMVQHLLLMIAAPALLLLGAPQVPLLRGLPQGFAKHGLGPFLAAAEIRRAGEILAHPLAGWLALSIATWFWHAPAPYQMALRSPLWHAVEHATFVLAGLLFWWPVVQPWPSQARWPRWTVPLYLLLADLQNTLLSAILIFSDRLIYPIYAESPRLAGISPSDDQITAGALMWVPMSLAYLIPAAVITVQLLSPRRGPGVAGQGPVKKVGALADTWHDSPLPRPPAPGPRPLFAFIRSALFRRTLQTAMLTLAAVVVADGLLGPQMSPMNLAGVLPWTYWRGFTVVALFAVGNLFCMACPFTLPRGMARRLGGAGRSWPNALRSKWLGAVLLVVFFCANEGLAIWDRPRATAVLILAYFAAAFAVDTLFRGAAFCKYVCPIGQFQFVNSLLSPFEVKVRQPAICATCTTHDCLRGGPQGPGCATELFLPRKASSLDCTFCLDCVRACPHDNVGIAAIVPASELWRDPERASLGRLSRRIDIAALALVLVAASVMSAAAMVQPFGTWMDALALRTGLGSHALAAALLLALGVTIAPALLLTIGTATGRLLAGVRVPLREIFCRLALALVPLGGAMWAAHFLFHLAGGWASALPPLQRTLAIGDLDWLPSASPIGADTLLLFQVLLLDAGLLLALYSGWRIAGSYSRSTRSAVALLLPWAVIAVAVYASGVWVFLQPMEMRGVMIH